MGFSLLCLIALCQYVKGQFDAKEACCCDLNGSILRQLPAPILGKSYALALVLESMQQTCPMEIESVHKDRA